MNFFFLLVAYGITFGIQNKLTFLRGKHPFLDAMLVCTYCTGFHGGWITWVLYQWPMFIEKDPLEFFNGMILFAFASAAFSYAFDSVIRLVESHSDPLEVVDEDEEDSGEE